MTINNAMKNKLFCLLVLVAAASGCKKDVKPVVLPEGNFTGTFRRIHLSSTTGKKDTLTADLTLLLGASTGFAVAGDTTKHAGSRGSYVVDGSLINFYDSTFPTSGTPAKVHLAGIYQYAYDGKNLVITVANDTLNYYYSFKANPSLIL